MLTDVYVMESTFLRTVKQLVKMVQKKACRNK
ncbi:hypothetical protein ACT7DL_12035 [Bacillus paranthracis]